MKIAVYGPNLLSGGADFHVHAPGCADTKKSVYSGHVAWEFEAESKQAVVEEIFADIMAENEEEPWVNYAQEVKFFPCAAGLG